MTSSNICRTLRYEQRQSFYTTSAAGRELDAHARRLLKDKCGSDALDISAPRDPRSSARRARLIQINKGNCWIRRAPRALDLLPRGGADLAASARRARLIQAIVTFC